MYLTNHSNTQAGAIDVIAIEERKFWLRGLRQAELTIREKTRAIAAYQRAKNKFGRETLLIEELLRYLVPLSVFTKWLPVLGRAIDNHAESLKSKLQEIGEGFADQESLLRDAELELKVAHQERARILQENPIAEQLSYEELQNRYSHTALLEQKAHYLAARLFAAEQGLPEVAGAILLEASNAERQFLLERFAMLRSDMTMSLQSVALLERLATLTPEQQRSALLYIDSLSPNPQQLCSDHLS